MATATCHLSELQFRCSVCLDVFTEPTSLPCGHNFCKACIDRAWADTVLYKCPYCKQIFSTKPELRVNIFIAEMSTQFRQSLKRRERNKSEQQQVAEPGEISCDVCQEPKYKASKSCLVCQKSYCSDHLKPHQSVSELKRHQLVAPQRDLEGRVCPEHLRVLDLYCQDEEACICVCCKGAHRGHQVVPVREVCEQKKQQLCRTQTGIENMIHIREGKIQELRRSVESTNSDSETEEALRVFTALRDAVDRALENVFLEIDERQATAKNQAESLILELEREISELDTQLSEVQQLSQSSDPLQILLQASKLKRSMPRVKDWSNVSVSTPTSEGVLAVSLSKLEEEFTKITKDVQEEELRRVKTFETLITLDGETAHPQLVVCQNGAQVNYSIEQRKVRNTLSRFEDFFVLGRQSFAQNFYFEAEMKGKTEWVLGVAKETVNRKGSLKLDPQNGVWAIGLKEKIYFACADQKIPLTPKGKPEKVGVFVDYGEGRVSFYDVENATLIFSFSGFSFRENLHPICSPGHYFYGNFAPLIMCQNTTMARRMTWPAKWPTLG